MENEATVPIVPAAANVHDAMVENPAPVNVVMNQEEEEEEEDDDVNDDEEEEEDPMADPRMEMTTVELTWAEAIKSAIEADPELDNLPDFWYAQLAIVCKDNVEAALQRAMSMQSFRQEYDIRDTIEDAKKTIWDFMNQFENFTLSFTYSMETQSYVWVLDISAFDKCKMQTDRDWRTHLAGIYYMRTAQNPDLLSISHGSDIVHECEGFDLFGKFGGFGTFHRMSQEIFGEYPSLHGKLKFFHSGTMVNTMCTMAKKVLNDEITEKFEFGCQMDTTTLRECFLVPDPQTAKERNYGRIILTLQRRYTNEAAFKL